ncbi:MAG: penicillin-binding protein 1C [Calditrichaeota bacterium]|nr:penicillin-binding protein 1C [Calditrichota bacterium]
MNLLFPKPRSFYKNRKSIVFISLIFIFLSLILWPVSQPFPVDYSTIVYDRNGEMLSVFLNKGEQWHFPPNDSLIVPEKLKKSVTQFEDRYFDYHPGVNLISLARATWQNISSGKVISGASTITMQVARLSNPKKRTIWSKILEMFYAVRLEVWYSKSEILNMYLNHAPYGGNTVGYRAASWRYFGKEPTALTWAESATLAVLPNAPGLISPQSNPQKLLTKRDRLLQNLEIEGIISEQDLQLARLEKIPAKVFDLPFEAPHFTTKINKTVKQGRVFFSSIDQKIQKRAEEIISNHAGYLQQQGISNAAAIVCNTQSGEITAYIGSHDFWDKENNGMVDGVLAPRSSGSILKPLLYALSMDDGLILPTTKMRDIPTFYGPFSPSNADEKFRGVVTAQTALTHSLNIPAVRLLNTFGYADFYEYLKLSGLNHLFRSADDYGLPLILGGAEVTLLEMAQMYCSLATPLINREQFTSEDVESTKKKNAINKNKIKENILDYTLLSETKSRFQSGRTQRAPRLNESQSIISKGAAYLTLQMLKEVNRPGAEYYWQQFQNQWPLAWKTGTSYGQRDAWAVGVNPQWTIAVWAGNFTGEGNPELAGSRSAGPILFDLFNMLPKDKSLHWFERPENELSDVKICKWSGNLDSEHCPDPVIADAPRLMKTMRLCPWHRSLFVDTKEKYEVCSLCWQEGAYHKVQKLILPADINQYLRQQGQIIEKVPMHNPACPGEHNEPVLEIIYPTENAHIWVPRDYDGLYQKVTIRAVHRQENIKVFWYLDDFYAGETSESHVKNLSLENGWHRLVLVDENGRKSERHFFSGKN